VHSFSDAASRSAAYSCAMQSSSTCKQHRYWPTSSQPNLHGCRYAHAHAGWNRGALLAFGEVGVR
jgi:hypothetical protein